jgi:hypothetical protein
MEVEVSRENADTGAPALARRQGAAPATRGVRHDYTRTLPSLLSQLDISLLVSTYQAGKVMTVEVVGNKLALSYHNFERAMGLAAGNRPQHQTDVNGTAFFAADDRVHGSELWKSDGTAAGTVTFHRPA